MKSVLGFLILLFFFSPLSFGDSTKTCLRSVGEGDNPPQRPDLLYQINKSHFVIHWQNPTSEAYANEIAELFEDAYVAECINMGWQVPPADGGRGGNDKYDIYVVTTENPDIGSYNGLTISEPDEQYEWSPSFILIVDTLVEVSRIMVTAHEFNHACQLSYTYKDGEEDYWFYENTAVWIAEEVYNYDFNYWTRYGAGPFDQPQYGIHSYEWLEGDYYYAGFIWPKFLAEWQDDSDIVRKIWYKMSQTSGENILGDINAVLSGSPYETSLDEALRYYAEWRYFTGSRDDGLHFNMDNDGEVDLPEARIEGTYTGSTGPKSVSLNGVGGTKYFVFNFSNYNIAAVEFDGDDSFNWIAAVIKQHQIGFESPNIKIELNSLNEGSKDFPTYEEENIKIVFTPVLLNIENSDPVLAYFQGTAYYGMKTFLYTTDKDGIEENDGQLILDDDFSDPIPTGWFKWLRRYSPHIVEPLDERFPTSPVDKHHNWNNNLNDFYLEMGFTVPSTLPPGQNEFSQIARFDEIYYSKIEARLEGLLIEDKGDFEFQDPWYVKSDGSQGGLSHWIECKESYEPTGSEEEETGGVFLDQEILSTNPYYAVKTTSPQDIPLGGGLGTREFNFFRWDGTDVTFEDEEDLETGVVFQDIIQEEDPLVQAYFKGHLLSNDQNGFSSGTQRRLVRTDNGIYHLVYESMGYAWYTHSLTSDFNGNWSDELIIGCKNPSLDADGNNILIVLEDYFGSGSANIPILECTAANNYEPTILNPLGNPYPSIYFGSARPVVIWLNNCIFIAYRKNSADGIYCIYKVVSGPWGETLIPGTNNSSLNPSIVGFLINPLHFIHLAYQEDAGIKYRKMKFTASAVDFLAEATVISSGSGYKNNYSPSISIAGTNNPLVSWIGDNEAGIGKINKSNGSSSGTSQVVIRRGTDGTWGTFKKVGNNVVSANNNSITSSYEKSIIVWSEANGSSYDGKWIRRENSLYIDAQNLSNDGKQNQVSNGSSLSNMGSTALIVSTTPYDVNMSTTDFSAEVTGGGGIGKITSATDLTYGREGIASIGAVEFVFDIGDVFVGDSVIRFISRPDTLPVSSEQELNQVVRTVDFALDENTEFYFTNFYYVINQEYADSSLTENDAVNFKAELVKSSTNQVIGTYDNITYNLNNLEKYDNVDYQVNCSGITAGNYYLRLVTTVAGEADLTLADIQNTSFDIEKKNYSVIEFSGETIPEEYALYQNYPNPFNPNTTIKFQLPQSGNVTLKIYDILGREVITLVDDFKTEGRYEVNFNASQLASGVYLYSLTANDPSASSGHSFADVKKMILLK